MDFEAIVKECLFKTLRSSGPGGQHVNKVSSKVVLSFDVAHSVALSDEEKTLLYQNLPTKLTKDKMILISCEDTRSQHKNKEIVIDRFFELLKNGLKKPKARKATKPTKVSIKKRLESKKKLSEKKNNRKKPF